MSSICLYVILLKHRYSSVPVANLVPEVRSSGSGTVPLPLDLTSGTGFATALRFNGKTIIYQGTAPGIVSNYCFTAFKRRKCTI